MSCCVSIVSPRCLLLLLALLLVLQLFPLIAPLRTLGTIRLRKRLVPSLRAVESSQRGLISHLDDPKAMWDTLAAHFKQKRPATRFASYEALLSVQKQDDKTLPVLSMRVEKLLKAAQNARSTDFSLRQLDEDLACMALI